MIDALISDASDFPTSHTLEDRKNFLVAISATVQVHDLL